MDRPVEALGETHLGRYPSQFFGPPLWPFSDVIDAVFFSLFLGRLYSGIHPRVFGSPLWPFSDVIDAVFFSFFFGRLYSEVVTTPRTFIPHA